MALKATFTQASIYRNMQEAIENFENAVIFQLNRVGTECINVARELGDYIDRTGNLRSSVGYVIVKDGTIIKGGGFQRVTGSEKRFEEGELIGRDLAEKLASEHSQGFVLIVVAGMNYATSVESLGYDVLSSSEMFARTEIVKVLQKLKSK